MLKVHGDEAISEVKVQGGEVIYGEVKVQRESDGTREQQQPQRRQQHQQPPLQQQQDQVGPLSACDDRPEEQQQQQVHKSMLSLVRYCSAVVPKRLLGISCMTSDG